MPLLDLLVKYLPLLVFIVPLIAWLDKAKRFSHRRKFYVERLEAAQTYIDKYHNKSLSDFEKDCAAQALVGSEKIDHKRVDYVIEHCPQRFFFMTKKLVTAYYLIDVKEENGKTILSTPSTKARRQKIRIILVFIYCSSALVLYSNNIAVYLINKTGFLHPIPVSGFIYLLGVLVTLILGIGIAVLSGLLYSGVDAALEIHDDLNIQHRP